MQVGSFVKEVDYYFVCECTSAIMNSIYVMILLIANVLKLFDWNFSKKYNLFTKRKETKHRYRNKKEKYLYSL